MGKEIKESDWMFSDNIYKRSLSVFVYSSIGYLLVIIPVMLFVFILGFIIGLIYYA